MWSLVGGSTPLEGYTITLLLFFALCFMLPGEAVVSQLPVPAAMPVA